MSGFVPPRDCAGAWALRLTSLGKRERNVTKILSFTKVDSRQPFCNRNEYFQTFEKVKVYSGRFGKLQLKVNCYSNTCVIFDVVCRCVKNGTKSPHCPYLFATNTRQRAWVRPSQWTAIPASGPYGWEGLVTRRYSCSRLPPFKRKKPGSKPLKTAMRSRRNVVASLNVSSLHATFVNYWPLFLPMFVVILSRAKWLIRPALISGYRSVEWTSTCNSPSTGH